MWLRSGCPSWLLLLGLILLVCYPFQLIPIFSALTTVSSSSRRVGWCASSGTCRHPSTIESPISFIVVKVWVVLCPPVHCDFPDLYCMFMGYMFMGYTFWIQLSKPTKFCRAYLTENMHHHHIAKVIHSYTARYRMTVEEAERGLSIRW